MTISFATSSIPAGGTLVLPVSEGRALTPAGQAVDEATGGALGRAMAATRFEGKASSRPSFWRRTGWGSIGSFCSASARPESSMP